VRVGRADGPHFVQHDMYACLCHLPRGLAAREAATDNMNRVTHTSGLKEFMKKSELILCAAQFVIAA
jgi:hypothetical protein